MQHLFVHFTPCVAVSCEHVLGCKLYVCENQATCGWLTDELVLHSLQQCLVGIFRLHGSRAFPCQHGANQMLSTAWKKKTHRHSWTSNVNLCCVPSLLQVFVPQDCTKGERCSTCSTQHLHPKNLRHVKKKKKKKSLTLQTVVYGINHILMYSILISKWILNRPVCTSTSWLAFVIMLWYSKPIKKGHLFPIYLVITFPNGKYRKMKGSDFSTHATRLHYWAHFGTFLSV